MYTYRNLISAQQILSFIIRPLNPNIPAETRVIFVLNASAWTCVGQHCPFWPWKVTQM